MRNPYVVYSNTEYLDILQVQTDFISHIENKILLIDKNNLDTEHIYKFYDKVIFYNNDMSYPQRVSQLKNLKTDYILFTHDIDILIDYDETILEELFYKSKYHNLDRIDLQYQNTINDPIEIKLKDTRFYLTIQKDPNLYIYNVNPSIWKLNSFIDVMNKFPNETYRTIENKYVQDYCINFDIYKLYSEKSVSMGYFTCLDFYKFLHITHGGGLLPISDNGLDVNDQKVYKNILSKYNLIEKRGVRKTRW